MDLKKISSTDLLFSNEIEDDRTNTYLSLDDYDWMNYHLKTRFRTEELGILKVDFSYFGFVKSTMTVEQTFLGETKEYVYSYPTDIFVKYLKSFLTKHMNSWDDEYAFNGEDIVVAFYNEVLSVGTLTDGVHI